MRTGETETAQEPPPICAHAEAFLDMLRSEEAAEAIGPAMQCCYHYDARPRDPFYDEERELAEVRYKHAFRRLKRAYPGMLCRWSEHSQRRFAHVATSFHLDGYPILAVQKKLRVIRDWEEEDEDEAYRRALPDFCPAEEALQHPRTSSGWFLERTEQYKSKVTEKFIEFKLDSLLHDMAQISVDVGKI